MSSTNFTHQVAGPGPAKGMTFTGRRRVSEPRKDVPLIIALHGGTYSSLYFDLPGYSLMDRSASAGIPIVAVDRPSYGGSTAVPKSDSILLKNAEVLDHAIAELWQAFGQGTAGVFVIGHSIGGAITTAIAAKGPTSWPLKGVAISGCLLQVPAQARDGFNALPDIPSIDLPVPMKDQVMFGPAWTHDTSMPKASYPSNTSIPRAELIDINNGWIDRVRSVNAKVKVPVHARQGEFDALWITDAQQVKDFGLSFAGSPQVDCRPVLRAGHCIDFHHAAAGFQLSQLAFALECCVPFPPVA